LRKQTALDTGAFDTVWSYLLLYLESALAVKFKDASQPTHPIDFH